MLRTMASARSAFVAKTRGRVFAVLVLGMFAVSAVVFGALPTMPDAAADQLNNATDGPMEIAVALPYVAFEGVQQGQIHFAADPLW